jgi:hypothetical protein
MTQVWGDLDHGAWTWAVLRSISNNPGPFSNDLELF